MHCDNTKTSSEIEHVDWSTGTGSGHHYANVRFGSGSSQASQSSGDICRICHCESDPQNPLLTPCYCAGSLKYVHQTCLQQWLTASETNSCELCKFPFIMHTKIKPFNEWRSLDISGIERRRLCCSVLFHCAAALCVIWSLCVLIERAADDVQRGQIDWPFWTKLAVVTVGLTGGVVFMYIQCKAYLQLCHRWKARNRILLIQNAPEKVHPLSPPSPATLHRSRHEGSSEPRTSGLNAGLVGVAELPGNVATASNAYNYVTADGGVNGAGPVGSGGCVGSDILDSGASVLLQHRHHLPASPHHMLQRDDLDMDAMALHTASGLHQQPLHHIAPQVAVSANIECSQSQHNYERDWALDDVVSQISSFHPCPQGSGSMTPFHDSIHNVLEHSENSSRGSMNDVCGGSRQDLSTGGVSSDTGRENALQLSSFSGSGEHKAPSISSGVSNAVANGLGGFVYKPHTKRYSNSSIFLENRDILNDSMGQGLETSADYATAMSGGISYRHSHDILTPPGDASRTIDSGSCAVVGDDDQLERFIGKDLRRYSDTKLLTGNNGAGADAEVHDPMLYPIETSLNMPMSNATSNARLRHLLKQHSASAAPDTVLDMELPTSPLSPPAAYAALPPQSSLSSTLHRSMQTVGAAGRPIVKATPRSSTSQQSDTTRPLFKSLPNLSSSCESLLKK